MELKKILYVEDDGDIQMIGQMTLESEGYEVIAAASGSEALTLATFHQPHLILMDVMMPGMDGITVLKTMMQSPNMPKPPVIFMTAKAQKHEVDGFHELGAIGVITKPFDPITLGEQIKKIWDIYVAQ